MNIKSIMESVYGFVDNNYNKGKKIANHTTWATIIGFFIYMEMIRQGEIPTESVTDMIRWGDMWKPIFYAILGLRVAGGGWKTYVDTKHGNGNGHAVNEASK